MFIKRNNPCMHFILRPFVQNKNSAIMCRYYTNWGENITCIWHNKKNERNPWCFKIDRFFKKHFKKLQRVSDRLQRKESVQSLHLWRRQRPVRKHVKSIQPRTRPRLQKPTWFLYVSSVQFKSGGLEKKVQKWQMANGKSTDPLIFSAMSGY